MTIYITNKNVPYTDKTLIDAIKAYMVDKHQVTGADLVQNVPALQGMPRAEQEQAVIDAGLEFWES